MTTGQREAGSPRDDALLSRLYQQVTEEQAARFAAEYDMAACAWPGTAPGWASRPPGSRPGRRSIPAAAPAQLPPAPP